MGDSSHVAIKVKACDVEAFRLALNKAYGSEYDYLSEEDQYLVDPEASYGLFNELEMMFDDPDCPPFSYSQDKGDTYGPCCGVHMGEGRSCIQNIDENSGDPILPVGPDGYDQELLDDIHYFWQLWHEFKIYYNHEG